MIAILKIRLTYVKRKFCSNIYSLFYPVIVLSLIYYILKDVTNLESVLEPDSGLPSSLLNVDNTKPYSYFSSKFSTFDESKIKKIKDGKLGIITKDKEISNLFKTFAEETFCQKLNSTNNKGFPSFDDLVTYLNIPRRTEESFLCEVKIYETESEYKKYINSIEYNNTSAFNLVIEIKKEEDENLIFNVMNNNVKITSIEKAKNTLTFDFPNKLSMVTSALSQNSVDDTYQNIFLIITNFLKRYKKINTEKNSPKINIYYKPLNTPPVKGLLSNNFIGNFIPMYLSISFGFILFHFVLWMIKEKSNNSIELFFRHGISPNKYYFSWFLTYILLNLPQIIICTIILSRTLFTNISFIYIFISLILYYTSLFGTAMLFQSLTKNVESSQTLLKFLYIFLGIISTSITQSDKSLFLKIIFFNFPQVLLVQNFHQLTVLDNFKINKGFLDSELLLTPHNKISLLGTFLLYIMGIFTQLFISNIIISYQKFYSSSINDNGSFKNLFLFLKNFFYIKNLFKFNFGYVNLDEQSTNNKNTHHSNSNLNILDTESNQIKNSNHEKYNENQINCLKTNNCLSIKNISKSFVDVQAVDNFTGDLFPSEIFCLLGHNGAGKTTLIKIISGNQKPDNGDIFLFGNSILSNKKILYKNIGVCEQENIFFEYLTVYEHLKYFSELKQGIAFLKSDDIEKINELISKLGLDEKKNSISKTLSGGQKRRLCIALALTGNSKLVLLDEPTSGMDVLAKRELWNFFKLYKKDKIIILTTHSLEEAEFLGDRMGIMLDGKFICSGTSSYLKNKYPCGYYINFLTKDFSIHDITIQEKRNNLLKEFKKIDDSASIKISSKNLISINFISMLEEHINGIFKLIENEKFKEDFDIVNYTISTTSLEDVFLKLNNNELSKSMFNDILKENKNSNEKNTMEEINKELDLRNNMVINLNNENSMNNNRNQRKCNFTFFQELNINIKRNIITLWRKKIDVLLEIFSASCSLVLFVLGMESIFTNKQKKLELMNLYEGLPLYYTSNINNTNNIEDTNFFNLENKNFYIYEKYPFINIQKIDFPYEINQININTIANYFYNISKYKNERNFLCINHNKQKDNIDIYILYQTASREYFPATLSYILSILFEEQYNIKTPFLENVKTIPLGIKPNILEKEIKLIMLFYSVFLLWMSFLTISGYMTITPLNERINNINHLIKLSGGNMFIYWVSLLIVDIIKYFLFLLIVLSALIYFDTIYLYTAVMIIPFLFAMNSFAYAFSFIFDTEINCQKFYLLNAMLSSLGLLFGTYFYNKRILFDLLKENKFIITFCDIFPLSSFMLAIFRFMYCSIVKRINFFNVKLKLGYVLFNHSIIFIAQFIFYSFLLFLFQIKFFERIQIFITNCFLKNSSNNSNYERVGSEFSINNNVTIITTKIKNLYKIFISCCRKNVKAVNGLSLNLEKNEHFGLIGFNGSGKTTTFKSITKEIFYNKGNIEIFGYNVGKNSDFEKLTKDMGYCPQENALFEYLTVGEVLQYFKKLKSNLINEINNNKDENIKEICERFGLEKYINKITTKLSGGNKRKLNFAIALMNYPKIVLLDEPSTGVDPESRRLMWKNINLLSMKKEYNMILSTHSMEEAEILCDTVGWMKDGNFVCVGIPEELKIKFSSGYYLLIKLKSNKEKNENEEIENIDVIKNYMKTIINDENEINILFGENENNLLIMNKIYKIFKKIEGKFTEMKVLERDSDNNVFKFLFHVEKNGQGEMFRTLLNIKSNMDDVSEININIESLENIFTKFQ